MRILLTTLTIMAIGVPCFGQNQWVRVEKTDALRGTSYSQFTLTGKFLTPPRQDSPDPVLVVNCSAGEFRRGATWQKNGKFRDAYMTVGAVVDFRTSGTPVQYRLDDSKVHSESWDHSTDGTALFLEELEFNTLLYDHFMPHKEGTGEAVHKIVISVNEYLGAAVVLQFDVPDPTAAADTCGIILYKRAK